jgi:hypothetical protein
MACNTSRWTLVASINQAILSSRNQLHVVIVPERSQVPCLFVGCFEPWIQTPTISSTSCPLNQLFQQADSSLVSRRCKSFWPRVQSIRFPEKVIKSAISGLYKKRILKIQEFLFRHFKKPPTSVWRR